MKRFIIALFMSFLLILSIGFFSWTYKSSLLGQIISKQLSNVPVRLEGINISKNCVTLKDLFIGNIPQSKTNISFGSEKIAIDMSLKKIMEDPFIIDSVSLKDTLIAVEYFNESGSENNWQALLNDTSSKWKIKKSYLIKKLILENVTIQVRDHSGKVTKYPTINKMEFFNINHNLESTINQIDKVVLNTILRAVFSRLGLDNLLDNIKSNQVIVPHISSNSKKTREVNSRVYKP